MGLEAAEYVTAIFLHTHTCTVDRKVIEPWIMMDQNRLEAVHNSEMTNLQKCDLLFLLPASQRETTASSVMWSLLN